MKVPFNMTTPRMKLHADEQVIEVQEGLRKKGIFGNRFGELYVTNQRIAFVKAIMKAGLVSMVANKVGATPIIEFDRKAIKAEKVQHKKQVALVIHFGEQQERFLIDPNAIDKVIGALAAS